MAVWTLKDVDTMLQIREEGQKPHVAVRLLRDDSPEECAKARRDLRMAAAAPELLAALQDAVSLLKVANMGGESLFACGVVKRGQAALDTATA